MPDENSAPGFYGGESAQEVYPVYHVALPYEVGSAGVDLQFNVFADSGNDTTVLENLLVGILEWAASQGVSGTPINGVTVYPGSVIQVTKYDVPVQSTLLQATT